MKHISSLPYRNMLIFSQTCFIASVNMFSRNLPFPHSVYSCHTRRIRYKFVRFCKLCLQIQAIVTILLRPTDVELV